MMQGKFFEEFKIGDKFRTASKTVSQDDMDFYLAISGGHPIHSDDEFAKKLGFKRKLAPGYLTLILMNRLMNEAGLISNLVAFLGINKVRFIKPVMPGDIIRFECEVTAKKETKKTDRGVIKFKNIGKNQDGETILDAEVTFMIRRKE